MSKSFAAEYEFILQLYINFYLNMNN